MTDWLSTLRSQVSDASVQLGSSYSTLQHERQRISRMLDGVVDRLGHNAARRDTTAPKDLHDRVTAAFHRQDYEDLTLREQRYAAKRFDMVQPMEMQQFLAVHPSNWDTFAKECFRRWDALAHTTNRGGYTRLLCLAPNSVEFLHRNGRIQDLCGTEGTTAILKQINSVDLSRAREKLQDQGLESYWAFSSIALALWAWQRSRSGGTFDALFSSVANDLTAEAMLLPRRRGENSDLTSWFSTTTRPPRVRNVTYANAVFVATMLRMAVRAGAAPNNLGAVTDAILRAEFRDPRVPPDSEGWAEVKRVDAEHYQLFLEQLISEDLEIFFDHAMSDPRRRKFWLRYLKSVRRTACILDNATNTRLKERFAGADKKLVAALSRAHRFAKRTRTPMAQAFCLYFDNVVIVEFSQTGNAAFIYSRDDFERTFESDVRRNQLDTHDDLKRPNLCRERLIHSSHSWEQTAEQKLMGMGIYRDR